MIFIFNYILQSKINHTRKQIVVISRIDEKEDIQRRFFRIKQNMDKTTIERLALQDGNQ